MKKNFVPAKGARLLRKVTRHILAEPRRYNQNDIISHGKPGTEYSNTHKFPACGTVACIGGWINIFTLKNPSKGTLNETHLSRVLGVPRANVDRLVAGIGSFMGWPVEFANAYDDADTPRQKAGIAARRIEHFIKTGE